VAAIVLDRHLTGGIGMETSEGDTGLLVVVEPRDAAGRMLDAPAEMSVVVLDPALQGNAVRIARWDFTPDETATMFRRTGAAQALHLTMTWPEKPPIHGKLHLFVRYVTLDGRKLEVDQPIEVALPGDKTARWTRNEHPTEPPPPAMASRPDTSAAIVPAPSAPATSRSDNRKSRRPLWSPNRR
jgi:hypothetical protein